MNTEIKEEQQVLHFHFGDGAKIPNSEIRIWHSKVFDAINLGAPRYSIASGNSMVIGYRMRYENTIEILEFTSGYDKYSYPQPNATIPFSPSQKHLKFIYDRLINVHQEDENTDYMIKLKEIIGQ